MNRDTLVGMGVGVFAGAITKVTIRAFIPAIAGSILIGYAGQQFGVFHFDHEKANLIANNISSKLNSTDISLFLSEHGVPAAFITGAAVTGFVFGFKYF